jgi:hypothetical protein
MDNAEQINGMIDKILCGDNTSAKEDFEALIFAKVASAIEVKKQEVAQSIYQGQEVTDDEAEETDPEVA